jgi:hypothetical protein
MLLSVKDKRRDFLGDVVRDIVPEDKRDSLTFVDVYAGHEPIPEEAILVNLFERHGRTFFVAFCILNGYI